MSTPEIRCPACKGIDVKDLGAVPLSKHAQSPPAGSKAPTMHRFRCDCGNTFDREVRG